MFDIASTELLIIAVVALVIIGPKDLPRVLRTVGQWVGRARGMARHFRSGLDTMIREAELDDLEQQWKAQNDRIMRDYPAAAGDWFPDPPARPADLGAAPTDSADAPAAPAAPSPAGLAPPPASLPAASEAAKPSRPPPPIASVPPPGRAGGERP